jgi:hypothetical protein
MTVVPMRLALDRSSAAQQTYQGELAVVTHACRKLTIQRAKQIVNSWPEWKRERIVFRDKSTSTTSSEAAPLETIALRKRSV